MQRFLWQFKRLRHLFLKATSQLWALSASHRVREYAFFFLRNACALPSEVLGAEKALDATKEFEAVVMRACKSFCDAGKRGYSWRSLSTFRFMENCIVELLSLDDKTAYRVTYSCVRRMAVLLRNSIRAAGAGMGNINKDMQMKNLKSGGKLAKKKAKTDHTVAVLYQWQFVRSMYLWTKVLPFFVWRR